MPEIWFELCWRCGGDPRPPRVFEEVTIRQLVGAYRAVLARKKAKEAKNE